MTSSTLYFGFCYYSNAMQVFSIYSMALEDPPSESGIEGVCMKHPPQAVRMTRHCQSHRARTTICTILIIIITTIMKTKIIVGIIGILVVAIVNCNRNRNSNNTSSCNSYCNHSKPSSSSSCSSFLLLSALNTQSFPGAVKPRSWRKWSSHHDNTNSVSLNPKP